MTTAAMQEARDWYGKLADAEFRGRGDREKSVRARIAQKTGIPESYLYRLQYKTRETKDVAGEVYRRLLLAYTDLCQRQEQAAADARRQRQEIENAASEGDHRPEVGGASPVAGQT